MGLDLCIRRKAAWVRVTAHMATLPPCAIWLHGGGMASASVYPPSVRRLPSNHVTISHPLPPALFAAYNLLSFVLRRPRKALVTRAFVVQRSPALLRTAGRPQRAAKAEVKLICLRMPVALQSAKRNSLHHAHCFGLSGMLRVPGAATPHRRWHLLAPLPHVLVTANYAAASTWHWCLCLATPRHTTCKHVSDRRGDAFGHLPHQRLPGRVRCAMTACMPHSPFLPKCSPADSPYLILLRSQHGVADTSASPPCCLHLELNQARAPFATTFGSAPFWPLANRPSAPPCPTHLLHWRALQFRQFT